MYAEVVVVLHNAMQKRLEGMMECRNGKIMKKNIQKVDYRETHSMLKCVF